MYLLHNRNEKMVTADTGNAVDAFDVCFRHVRIQESVAVISQIALSMANCRCFGSEDREASSAPLSILFPGNFRSCQRNTCTLSGPWLRTPELS